MRNIIIRLRIIFLFIAILAINAHMIIPHDHHLPESFESQEEQCPFSHNEVSHHSGFPVHCHACNDLASEKVTTFVTNRNIQCKFFLADNLFNFHDLKSPISAIKVFDIVKKHFKSEVSTCHLLRAPPSFA